MNAYFAINCQETDAINLEKYDVEVIMANKMSNKMKNTKNTKNLGKYNLFRDDIEALKNDKNIKSRERDSRYAFKNRRTVNKDWKDFNNNQM